ncbi:FAD-dependent oxidoreductase [Sphingopyxis sp. Root214]|uniref:NAD(P)/FAD-dependent oxidoreductase n=1 Tax=unclassified Sphingopyxis TaxID=2614943 RepID=UPI0006F620B1|nr:MULTISPECIES: FAD-binding oxidoreductase [unclassified Sphingopyxis]KQZ69361.1 FAD-dependent oxidoreductase [Sphingopyxis sp. Root154]KRC10763.1 FAD-dependent oxidoreductase [Sphingopyxis sp. Root214]
MPNDFPSRSSEPQNAVVIGGGVVGLATALALQKRDISVTLIDSPPASPAASWGNAGHIAIEQVEPLASRATIRSMPRRLFRRGGALSLPWRDIGAWLPFSLRLVAATSPARFAAGRAALGQALGDAMGSWRRLLGRIGAGDLLVEDGHYILWESAVSAEAGRAHWAATDIGQASMRDATPAEQDRLAALTSAPVAGAVHIAGSGQIADLDALGAALRAGFDAAGGSRIEAKIDRLLIEDGRAVAIAADGTRHTADAMVIASGAASGTLMASIGQRVPIIAERGYHIQSADTGWPQDMPPVVFEDRSMIVTRFRSGLRAASFVEFGRGASPADPRKWARLRKHVAALGLSFGLPGAEWMGARPTLPDYLPAIGRSDRAANLFYAFGHQHLGLTLAATTGDAIAALVAGDAPPFDLAPFDLKRFGA